MSSAEIPPEPAAKPAAEQPRGDMIGNAGLVAAFTFLSRLLGFARDAVLTHVFGAGPTYDAFVIAQTIPNLLRRLVAEGSLVIAFVPLLAAEKSAGGLIAMRRYTRAVIGIVIPFLLVLVAIGMLFPAAVVKLFAAGLDAERAALAADLTRIMMPYILFISLSALAGGVLNLQGIFAAPAATPIFLNVAIISAALWLRDLFAIPMEAVAWGVMAGGVLQLLVQVPALLGAKLLVGPSWEPRHPAVLTLSRRMLPAVFGVAVYQLNMIVIRQIGSFLPAGQLSWYYTATRLQEFTLGVFAVSIGVAALPALSDLAAKQDWVGLKRTSRQAVRATNFITIPATVGLLALSGPVVGVLFRHGHFTAEDARGTAELLQIMTLAMVPIGAIRVTVPTFYALGETRTPVLAASASLVVTVAAGYLLVGRWQIAGLTAATTLAAAVQLGVVWLALRRALRGRASSPSESPDPSVLVHALRCLVAILPGGALAYLASTRIDWYGGRNLRGALYLFGLILPVIASYALLSWRLGLPELAPVMQKISRRFMRAFQRRKK